MIRHSLVLIVCLPLLASSCTRSMATTPNTTPLQADSSEPSPTTTVSFNNNPSQWPTFTNPQGLYSIQYPNNIGTLNVEYTTRGATLSWQDLDGTFTVEIGSVQNPDYLSLDQWLGKYEPAVARGAETISVNGMNGIILRSGYAGQTRVYLERYINSLPFIYRIIFECFGGNGQCSLPSFWQPMLHSFQGLPANE